MGKQYSINDIEVFIPTFNRPKFLDNALESLVTQTAGIPKITVFNNGINIETSNVIRKYEKYGVSEYKSKGGLLECMDISESMMTKRYVMFFHDDDILNCKYLEYAIKALNTYSDISFITTRYIEFKNCDEICKVNAKEEHYFFTEQYQFAQFMYLNECIAMQTAIYNVDLFKKNKRDSNQYGKFFDWPYLVDLAAFGNVVLFSDVNLFYVRRHEGQWTNDENSSWKIHQLINWHNKFFKVICLGDDNRLGYYIFYAKFKYFITGGYLGLVCQKYKEKVSYDNMMAEAKRIIGFNDTDPIYDRQDIIPIIKKYINKMYKIEKFGDNIKNMSVIRFLFSIIIEKMNNTSVVIPSYKKNTMIQNIFSIKNDKTGNYKVITLFGKKFFLYKKK